MSYIGKGLVIYCDGSSHKSNPGPYGYGLHWYTYSNEAPDTAFPLKTYTPTPMGYVPSSDLASKELNASSLDAFIQFVSEEKRYSPVRVLKCGEIAKGFPTEGTNNQGELNGLIRAFQLLLDERPDCTVIYSDSMYCIDGMRYLAGWKKNNWMSSTGKPVANKELWMELDNLFQKICSEKIWFVLKWINGHGAADKRSDAKTSNVYADGLAKIGASLSNNLCNGVAVDNDGVHEKIIYDGLTGMVDAASAEASTKSAKAKKKKEVFKPHPFLLNKRMYLGMGGRQDKHVFFMGNPGYQIDDIYIGKLIADAQISIVRLKERDNVVETIEHFQEKWLTQRYGYNNLMYTLLMNNITLSTVYSNIAEDGETYLSASSGVPNINTIDAKPITYVNDPVFLAAQNMGHLAELDGTLSGYLHKLDDTRVIDITHHFYETTEVTVTSTLQGDSHVKECVGKQLLKELGNDFKSIALSATFGGTPDCPTERTKDITLTTSVDIPRRNVFKGVEDQFPKVELLTWYCGGAVYRYAIVITTHERTDNGEYVVKDYGIWRGTTASQVLLLESN